MHFLKKNMAILTSKHARIFKTCNMYLAFIALGLCIAVPGPTLLDLKHIVNTTTQNIVFIYTGRSVGYLLGSLVGGIILDLVKAKQVILTICNLVTGLSIFAVPWTKNLPALTGCMVLNGITLGALDTGSNVCILNLWGKDSGPFFQALHFTFGLGCLIGPLLAAPFVGDYSSEESQISTVNSTIGNVTFSNFSYSKGSVNNNSFHDSLIYGSNIPKVAYVYGIIGGFLIVLTAFFVAAWLMSPNDDEKSKEENKQTRERSLGFISILVFINILLVFVETGTEIGFAQMLATYSVKGKLKLTNRTGSYITSVFWGFFTVARFASIFLAVKVSNLALMTGDLVLTSIGSLILVIASNYEWSLWVASAFLGTGIASFFPAALGYLDSYIDVTNKIAALFVVGAAFGEMVIPFTIGYFIEDVPDVLLYIVPASSAFCIILVLILYLILRKQETKFVTQEIKCYTEGSTNIGANISI